MNIKCSECGRNRKEIQIIGFELEDGKEVNYCVDCLEQMAREKEYEKEIS